jgi:hypothetical protein
LRGFFDGLLTVSRRRLAFGTKGSLFTGGSIALTPALVLLLYLVDSDECSGTFVSLILILALLPVGLPVGIFGMAGHTEEGSRAWPTFVVILIAGAIVPLWRLPASLSERALLAVDRGSLSLTAIGGRWCPGELGEGGSEFRAWGCAEAHHRQRLVD